MHVIVLTCDRRLHVLSTASFMHSTIDANDIQPVVVLQHRDVFQRISVHQYAVGIVTCLDFAQFMGLHKKSRHPSGRCNDCLL